MEVGDTSTSFSWPSSHISLLNQAHVPTLDCAAMPVSLCNMPAPHLDQLQCTAVSQIMMRRNVSCLHQIAGQVSTPQWHAAGAKCLTLGG